LILRRDDPRDGASYHGEGIWGLVTGGTAAVVTTLLAFRSGGYFPSEWGLQLGFFAVAALVVLLVADRISFGRRDLALIAGFAGLAIWSLVSIAWSPGPDGPVLAAERDLVYAGAAVALAVALSRERAPWLLGGVGSGIVVVCVYALATRVVVGTIGDPADTITGSRLAAPIGYANALGALAMLGLLLALGFAFHERRDVRAVAGAALVPLTATLYFTLSRGSMIALGVGVLAFLAVEETGHAVGALPTLFVAPAAAGLLAARSPLLDGGLSLDDARSAGHRLAVEIVLLTIAGGICGVLARPLARSLTPITWLAVATAAAAGAAGVVLLGPGDLAHRATERFRALPPITTGNPTRRLLSASASGRSEYWRVAWRMVAREPVLGEGAGSYERWWLQERPVANDARNAHNLYLETLAETGPVGLALLLVALGVPLAGMVRRGPLVAGAIAAYVGWLVHAFLDWDWQIPGVTLTAVACGAALVKLARDHTLETVELTGLRRTLGLVAIVPLLGVALVAHVGNRAADSSETALEAGRLAPAESEARRARTWMPWAAQPWQLLGEAELASHRDAQARISLRRALARDPDSWVAWYDLTAVTRGSARADALTRARRLNPLAPELR
jgi:O-antigen ligase